MTELAVIVNKVDEIWEFDYKVLADPMMQKSNIKPPFNPKNAFAGDRTNTFMLYYEGAADYIDFTSLYPFIQKYGKFPIGHQEIITGNYFGLVYCRIIPPRRL